MGSGSIESLLLDSAMQSELASDRTLANMESRHRANEAEANSMLSRVQKPTALGAGLQIASAAASGWSGVQAAKIMKGDNSPEAYAAYQQQMQALDALGVKYGVKPVERKPSKKAAR